MSDKIRPTDPESTAMNEELKAAHEIAKDPTSYSYVTYGWVIVLSMWGGVVRIVRQARLKDKNWRQIIGIFIGELVISGFAGCLTFYILESVGMKPLYTAVLTGVSGYMGGRAIEGMEALWRAQIQKDGK